MGIKKIKCIDCPNYFEFTEGEQKYFEERGFSEPKRCKDCRVKRRQEKEDADPENKRPEDT